MNKREQFENIRISLEEMETEANELHAKSYELRDKQNELICDIIREEKLLEGTSWILDVSHSQRLSLKFDGNRSNPIMEKLQSMILGGWHSGFMIEPDVELRFDDSDVTLQFKDSKLVPLFAQRNKFIIQATNITDTLHSLKRQISALETICHQFNLI